MLDVDLAAIGTQQVRILKEASKIGLSSWRFDKTPQEYYNWTLEERAKFLNGKSTFFPILNLRTHFPFL